MSEQAHEFKPGDRVTTHYRGKPARAILVRPGRPPGCWRYRMFLSGAWEERPNARHERLFEPGWHVERDPERETRSAPRRTATPADGDPAP
jgi:hypothetical protein